MDIAFLVELGGSQPDVERRIDLVRSVIGRLQATVDAATAVQAAVIGYRDHLGRYRRHVADDRDRLIVGCELGPIDAARQLLDREELWQAVPIISDLAAPVEDALHYLANTSSWRPAVRHVLVILGNRPPHPPAVGPENGLIIPCPYRYAWEQDLSKLREHDSVACFAVIDNSGGSTNSYYAKSWGRLGEEGAFAADDALERLLEAVVSQPIVEPHGSAMSPANWPSPSQQGVSQ